MQLTDPHDPQLIPNIRPPQNVMAHAVSIPACFSRTIADVYGGTGRDWLSHLPALIDTICERWELKLGERFDPLSYSYVVGAVRDDGTPVVLKASVPTSSVSSEIAALGEFAGRGTVQLLDADAGLGLLLLERLEPGTPLAVLRDDQAATSMAIEVIREMRTAATASPSFPTTAEWARGLDHLRRHFGGGTGPFPAALVTVAECLFRELDASTTDSVLLHGDLHHRNILAARRRPWLAIDPKGVVGDPAYELGALLRNPMPEIELVFGYTRASLSDGGSSTPNPPGG